VSWWQSIDPARLPSLIKQNLDGDLCVQLVEALLSSSLPERRQLDFLHWLAKVPRFDMTLMLLDDKVWRL
jgi:hypothetical protein